MALEKSPGHTAGIAKRERIYPIYSSIFWVLSFILLLFLLHTLSSEKVLANPLVQTQTPTAIEVVEAVNALRVSEGLSPLSAHSALMQAAQIEADGIAGGLSGHWRPENLTLGQWLLSLGYPLAGDLLQDGYRSENWVAASSAEEAVLAWQGDDVHTNTMLSQYRSDMGVGVAVGDEVYIVLITALRTRDGKMQSTAFPMLTQLASTSSFIADGTQVSQFVAPVVLCTARPDGDVIHKVQHGQSLWSIAIAYNTTINQICAWNNLGQDTIIYEGQNLLIQKGATQPATASPVPKATSTPESTATVWQSFAASTATALPSAMSTSENATSQDPAMDIVIGFILAALALGGLITVLSTIKRK